MVKCKECKFWGGRDAEVWPTVASCSRIVRDDGSRPKAARIITEADEAWLETEAEFGCYWGRRP